MDKTRGSEERVMLITGTSRGIGAYLAGYYAARGFQVIGCSRREVEREWENYRHVSLDISDEEDVVELFKLIRKEYKRLDVLINNAAMAHLTPAVLTPYKVVQSILNINVAGSFLFCREAARLMMKKRTGRIVNISSTASPLKIEAEAIYAASKAAVEKLTQVLAKELGPYGVTVNALGPCVIKTEMSDGLPDDMLQKILDMQALKRVGEFKDVSNAIDFFVSPDSGFITGQIIYLGGV